MSGDAELFCADDFWAHSRNAKGQGLPEPLKVHLELVARRARDYGNPLGAGEAAHLAGLLHDLGKFADQFQRRVRGQSEPGKDHSTAGAAVVLSREKHAGVPIALCIEGHHIGLQHLLCRDVYSKALANRIAAPENNLTDSDINRLMQRHRQTGLDFPRLASRFQLSRGLAGTMLDVRMLFSCLVDADFLETEAHFEGDATPPRRYRDPAPNLDFHEALKAVRQHVEGLASSPMQAMRSELFKTCCEVGQSARGLFTLTAPTGAGKTLAMLAFALVHAIANDLTRIVLVMPYLNIIDQTAQTYRKLFPKKAGNDSEERGFDPLCVLEDHSQAEANHFRQQEPDCSADGVADDLRQLRRLLAENWDAPIVLTTNVKCLESLHANKPSACRKLHRLAKSVVLFDEVQTLPHELVVPTLATLARLSERYDTSIVFATATQPAFDQLGPEVRKLENGGLGWFPQPIVDEADASAMFKEAARRVKVRWRIERPLPWRDLAQELAQAVARGQQVLCIVNLKRHARRLLDELRKLRCPNLRHLSTNMCSAHRRAVLDGIEPYLKKDWREPLCLVATQCVEAGVDLDFPIVYRALGPLEAIAQAAGRCNRHGVRDQPGQVHVFVPESDDQILYPGDSYKKAAQYTSTFLQGLSAEGQNLDEIEILNDPERIKRYYRSLYNLTDVTSSEKARALLDAIRRGHFIDVNNLYQLIDQNQITILVPYDPVTFVGLRARLAAVQSGTFKEVRDWMTSARPHAVSIHRPKDDDPLAGFLEAIQFRARPVDKEEADWFICSEEQLYDRLLEGLRTDIEFNCVR